MINKELEKRIDTFAEVAIKVGINVQKGEDLLIRADVDAKDFVRKLVSKAYECGAKNVYVDYSDEIVTKEKYLNAPDEAFDEYPVWQADKLTQIAKKGGSFLSVVSGNPDLMQGVDPERIGKFQKLAGKHLKEWRSYTLTDKCKWSIIAVPSVDWAKKVFPELNDEDAVNKLWEAILDCSRITDEGTATWDKHNKIIKEKTALMNELNFKELHYKSSKTDLVLGLVKDHIWAGGATKDPKGNNFNPNMPTEEIYSMPDKHSSVFIRH